jgi:hypothetical protein
MKNILKLLFVSLIILPFSCHDSENVIDFVNEPINGAVVRGVEVYTTEGQSLINSSNNESAFVATIEEQDVEDGDLMAEIRMYVDFVDYTPDNGDASSRALAATYLPSDMYEGPHGLPRKDIVFTWGQMKEALGFTGGEATAGDLLKIQFELSLTNGEEYGPNDAAGSILGGFFSSPYTYNALLSCDPAAGNYLVKMYDCWGDGWQTTNAGDGTPQSQGLEVYVDGDVRNYAMCSQWQPWEGTPDCTATADGYYAEQLVDIPAGSSVVTWTWINDYYAEIAIEVFGVGEFDATTGEWTGDMLYSSVGIGTQVLNDCSDGGLIPPGLLPISECAQ